MNRHFSHLILVLLSSAWPLMDAQAMFADESELSSAFRKLHKAKSKNPDSGQQLVEKILEDLAAQKREVLKKQAQDALQEKIEKWKCGLNFDRFSIEEQNKLAKQIPQAIMDFEEEQKISHGTDETQLLKLSLLSFEPLMNRLQKLGKNRLLKQQRQRKIDSEKENELLKEVKYHYDKENFVFLSENRDSYYKEKNFIPQKKKLEKNDIIEIYKILKIHKNSPAEKKNPEDTAKARKDFLELLKKQTGFIFLPTSIDGKLNVLIKVLHGPNQKVDYVFYKNQNLPLGLRTDERFTHLGQDHTFVALEHLVFAIPNSGPTEKILSLSTRQILGGGAMNDVYAMANTLWKQRALPQAMNIPSSEFEPEVSIFESAVSVSAPVISVSTQEVSISEPDVSIPQLEVPLSEPVVSIPQLEVPLSEPDVSIPQLEVPLSQPDVSIPQPEIPLSEPDVSIPQLEVPLSEPDVSIPQLEVPLSEPDVSIPQPEVSVPEPDVSIPQPEVPLSEPVVFIPQPEVPLSEPVVFIPQPEVPLSEPGVSIPQPEVPLSEPGVSIPQPEVSVPEPVVSIPQPEVSVPEPVVSIPQPEVSVPEPVVSIPQPEVIPNPQKARERAKTARKKWASVVKVQVVWNPQKNQNSPTTKGKHMVPYQLKIVESRGKNQKISKTVRRLIEIYLRHSLASAERRKKRRIARLSR